MSNILIKKAWGNFRQYVFITVGLILYAFSWKAFLLPYQITGGGITGVSAIVYYVTETPIYVTYFIINLFLLVLSVIIVGWKFSIRSIYGVLVLTLILKIIPEYQVGTFLSESDGFMSCVVGGIIWGMGYAILFLSNGSSGGTTIIARIINKTSNISLGRVLLYCDVIIICSYYFTVENSIAKVIYGLIAMGIATFVVDIVIDRAKQSVQFIIFSTKYQEIATLINEEIKKGITVFDTLGWHSQKEGKGIIVVARKDEANIISQIIKEIDPHAFISQSDVIGFYGKGHEDIFDDKK